MSELKDAESPEIQTDFDIHSPDIADTVYDVYDEMRSKCPVAHSKHYGGHWVATKYDDIQEVFKNPSVFSSESVNVPGLYFAPLPPVTSVCLVSALAPSPSAARDRDWFSLPSAP